MAPVFRRRIIAIAAVRTYAAKALPGKVLAVLEPQYQLVTEIFPCEDGHAQERRIFDQMLARVQARDLWIGDRNFCTTKVLFTIAGKQAYFVIRQHGARGGKL